MPVDGLFLGLWRYILPPFSRSFSYSFVKLSSVLQLMYMSMEGKDKEEVTNGGQVCGLGFFSCLFINQDYIAKKQEKMYNGKALGSCLF